MGFPHQVLPIVAILDIIATTVASVHLGLVPTPHFLTFQGTSTLTSLFDKVRGVAPVFASHTIIIENNNPKQILLMMLLICFFRCLVILITWASVKQGIDSGRVGDRSEDYSSRALAYSVVCILSILLNLSNLNLLFQTRGAPPNASLKAILLHMSASSLAAEQLIISAVEWILFVVVVGTNGLRSGPSPTVSQSSLSNGPEADAASAEIETEEQSKAVQPGEEVASTAEPSEGQKKKKDYGALTESAPTTQETNVASSHEQVPSSTDTSNESSEDPSAVSSDIVDIPRDRKASMQGAKDRLNRALENGKVRRRSLWKKVRGKPTDEAEA